MSEAELYVHTLVLEAFVGPRPAGQEVRHLNGRNRDNRLVNLQWGTPLENAADKVLHGTNIRKPMVECQNGHEFTAGNTIVGSDGARRCRTCNRDRARERQRRIREQGLPAGDPRHGTVTGARNFCCPCTPCREAGRAYLRRGAEQRRAG